MIKLKQIGVSLFWIFIISIIFTSCKVLSTSNGSVDMTLNYNPTNFHYIKTVYGSHSETYVLGRLKNGDPNGKGLNNVALLNLKREAQLKSNQTLINVAYDVKETRRWNRLDITVNISADVIELTNKSLNEVESKYLEGLQVSNKLNLIEMKMGTYDKYNFYIGQDVRLINEYSQTYNGIVLNVDLSFLTIEINGKKASFYYNQIKEAYNN